ncbi:MAG: hypothetical protein KA785_07220 [Spirochaetaceae bacterium]|nr:hypothetical protein [Spirochaetaceae bacterium]
MFGGIGISKISGLWLVTSTKQPALIRSGEFERMPNPSDIRGSYTWADVSSAFGIPVESVLKAFGSADKEEKVNSLETLFAGKVPDGTEIGTDSVRLFVSLFTALPHTPEETTVLPQSAVSILQKEGKADQALIEEAAKKAVSGLFASGSATAAEASSSEAGTEEQEKGSVSITGKTTFKNLIDSGYDLKKIEEITGSLEDTNMVIKDYCTANGIEFSQMRTQLTEL